MDGVLSGGFTPRPRSGAICFLLSVSFAAAGRKSAVGNLSIAGLFGDESPSSANAHWEFAMSKVNGHGMEKVADNSIERLPLFGLKRICNKNRNYFFLCS